MKTIKIYIGDEELSGKIDKDIWNNPEKFTGKHIFVVPPALFSKIFTKERLRLLKAIEKNPKNINTLVAMLGRPREAVSRDLSYLAGIGFIDLEKSGKDRVPTRVAPISVAV